MKRELTVWEIYKRIKFLREFRGKLESYFNIVDYNLGELIDNDRSRILRQEINTNLSVLMGYIREAGVGTTIFYSPPPISGGIAGNISILDNIFNLASFNVGPQVVIDILDQAVGIYSSEKHRAWVRTINPFWWLWRLFRTILHTPFMIFEEAGFNSKTLEKSIIGKIIKVLLSLALIISALIPILNAFGYQEIFVKFIKDLFKLP